MKRTLLDLLDISLPVIVLISLGGAVACLAAIVYYILIALLT